MKQVARAVSAPPKSFKPIKINDVSYTDGSIELKNPTWEVFNEIRTLGHGRKTSVDLIISMGTEGQTRSTKSDLPWNLGFWSLSRTVEMVAKSADAQVDLAMKRLKGLDTHLRYERFAVIVPPTGTSFEGSGRKRKTLLRRIEKATNDYLNDSRVQSQLADCARHLVEARRQRALTSRWEAFALGTRYQCPYPERCSHSLPFSTRVELLDHLIKDHNMPAPDAKHGQKMEQLLDESRMPGIVIDAFG